MRNFGKELLKEESFASSVSNFVQQVVGEENSAVLTYEVEPRVRWEEKYITPNRHKCDYIFPLYKPIDVPTVLFLCSTDSFTVGNRAVHRGLASSIAWTCICDIYMPYVDFTWPLAIEMVEDIYLELQPDFIIGDSGGAVKYSFHRK